MKRNRHIVPRIAALTLAATLPTAAAFAQFDFGGGERGRGRGDGGENQPPAWKQFNLNTKTRMKLDFRNASVDAVLKMYSEASGIAIIKDPNLTGGITLQSPKAQTLGDAFSMLDTVLGLKNFAIMKEKNFLVVRPKDQNNRAQFAAALAAGQFGGNRDSASQLRVYAIKYANATQVARVINEVFAAPPAAPGQPGAQPQPGNNNQQQGGGNNNRGGGRGGGRFGGGRGGGALSGSVVKASSDDFSNSVIVNAPGTDHEQIQRLIDQIDKQTDQPQQSKVFRVVYADATELAPLVQNVLVSNAPRGRGGVGTQNVPIEQRFQQAARFGSAQAAFGTVVPDPRTNTLVVTATQDSLVIAEKVIAELDKEVSFESSTFVITLQNARADIVSQLLNQSFGGRNGGGNFGVGNNNRTNNNRAGQFQQRPNRVNGGNRSQPLPEAGGDTRTRAADTPDGGTTSAESSALPLDMDDPNAESGELATRVSVKDSFQVAQNQGQNRQRGQGQGGQRTQQGVGGSGLDSQGRQVNVRDLTGQVVVVPDINTNSVIVVTSPENRELIESILSQLDKIPEQVMIETLIVEASLDASSKLGVEFNLNQTGIFGNKNVGGVGGNSFGLQANAAQPQGLRYTLTGTQYGVFLQALQTDSRFEVLSTPRIFTSNNSTAEINISQSLPYVVNQRFDNNGNAIFNYDFLDVGIILTVTPRITSNGYVTMDVTQTANDFVRYTDFNAPVVNQRQAQTTVSVRDGETIVLGGIIKNSISTTVNKVPLLGDIPLLGNLFRSKADVKNKTELLVFLTPRIVRDATEARKLRDETESKINPKTRERVEATLAPATPPSTAPVLPDLEKKAP
jgi:general secretion pathway protein D